jgi:nickel/cobalt exporter
MVRLTFRTVLGVAAAGAIVACSLAAAHAQSSLGIGTNEAMLPSTGHFTHLVNFINSHQQAFYRSLTGALKGMRQDGSRLWVLIGLSFVYGIFHAAGPGHGKAVISSYMLANEVALRRGVMLSFVSAMLQAVTAVALMTLVFFALRGTAVSMTDATWALEIASYVMVSAFGVWLLWRKLSPLWARTRPLHSLSAAHAVGDDADHIHQIGICTDHTHLRGRHTEASRSGAGRTMVACDVCGHAHAPDPSRLGGDDFSWRTAWSAVTAVGLRPCSGALIVLSFAFLNGLFAGGVLSVLAMALGTAITVSLLATLAVGAKNGALALAGGGRWGARVHFAIEIAGAAFVLAVGLLLLTASLSA